MKKINCFLLSKDWDEDLPKQISDGSNYVLKRLIGSLSLLGLKIAGFLHGEFLEKIHE